MLAVTEATFTRLVLRAALPTLVCFGARACPARRALLPALAHVAATHRGRLQVATVGVEGAPLLAELWGVAASPTLMVFQHGERQGQVVGFLAAGLLALLADEAAAGAVTGDSFWSPVEERFEDAVMIPLLQAWGFTVQRQVSCALAGRPAAQRGRIDLLVCDPQARPLTLVESKRQIGGAHELGRAAAQASAYAQSLALPSFLVAAPRGLWIYRRDEAGATCVAHHTSLELHQAPEGARQRILGLASP